MKHFCMKSLSPIEIKAELDATLRNESSSFYTTIEWIVYFKRAIRLGKLKSAAIGENIQKVH